MEGARDHAQGLEDWGDPGGHFRPGTGEPVAPAGVRGTKVGAPPPRQPCPQAPLTHILGLPSQPQELASHCMSR